MQFLFSSIGKKIQIAISGIFLCIFLIFHLLNNLTLFAGSGTFNQMVEMLESIKPFVRILEFGLLFILLTHVINGIKLTLDNKKAKPIGYSLDAGSEISSLNSQTMIISGIVILVFFLIHLGYIWFTYQTHNFITPQETYYDVVLRDQIGYLGHRFTAIFYILAIVLIGFHLKHGFQSALKTFGILQDSRCSFLYKISFLFWGIIPAGFIIIILSIQLGFISSV